MSEKTINATEGLLNIIERYVGQLTGKDSETARRQLGYYVKAWAKAEDMSEVMAYQKLIKAVFTRAPERVVMKEEDVCCMKKSENAIMMEEEDAYRVVANKAGKPTLVDVLSGEKKVRYLDYSNPDVLTACRILQTAKEEKVKFRSGFLVEMMQDIVAVPAEKCKNESKSNFLVRHLGEMVKSFYGYCFDEGEKYEEMSNECRIKTVKKRSVYVRESTAYEIDKVMDAMHPSRVKAFTKGNDAVFVQAAKVQAFDYEKVITRS